MPFHIIRDDITKQKVDAVVNAANPSLLGGGGVDGAIHRAAGPELREYCRTLGGCEVGRVKLSPGFRLPAKWIIHTVGPVWCGGGRGEEALLSACYRNALHLALEQGLDSVAFPLISAGAYGYPKDRALDVATREIGSFLLEYDMEVTLVIYDEESFQLSSGRFAEVRSYLERWMPEYRPASEHTFGRKWTLQSMARQENEPASPMLQNIVAKEKKSSRIWARRRRKGEKEPSQTASGGFVREDASPQESAGESASEDPFEANTAASSAFHSSLEETYDACYAPRPRREQILSAQTLHRPSLSREENVPSDLAERLRMMDESFSEMLLRKISEKGISDADCYKRANVDRKLFSKIRSDPAYRPSKPTAIAFAIALELPLPEARELLMKAGFALSHSNKFDIIIEFFILNGVYNIFEINETLFALDQNLLGA